MADLDYQGALEGLEQQVSQVDEDFDWSGFTVMFDGKHLKAIIAALKTQISRVKPVAFFDKGITCHGFINVEGRVYVATSNGVYFINENEELELLKFKETAE